MTAEPPRQTIHVTQHLLLDGFRILRAQLPVEAANETLAAGLDRCIEQLAAMDGMPIKDPGPRLYGLAHGMRVLIEDLLPFINVHTFDARDFPAVLESIEEALTPLRETGYRWAPDERPSSPGRTDLDVR